MHFLCLAYPPPSTTLLGKLKCVKIGQSMCHSQNTLHPNISHLNKVEQALTVSTYLTTTLFSRTEMLSPARTTNDCSVPPSQEDAAPASAMEEQ